MATAASDTSVNATDDVTPTAAVSSQEMKQNQASDPGSRLHGSLAPGVSPEVSQITTAVAPTDAAASTPKAVVQASFVAPTVTDVQTLNVEADPIVSFSGAALVVTDGTVPAIDTVTAVINKVSPSTQAVSLTTEAVTRANDVIASAMDAAAPTTISASLATDEVAQTTNEMSGTIIPATGGIDPVAKIVPLSTDTILLTLDDVVQGVGAVSTTKAMASAKYTPSPALPTVPPKGLSVIPALESAETVNPDASLLKPPSPDSFNLEVLAPEPNAPAPEDSEPEVSPPEVSAPEVSPPEASVPEPPLPETPTLESTPPANEGPPQIPASKSNSLDPAPSSKALSPDAPSLEASDPESPPLDAVGPKAPPTTKVVSLPDALLPDAVLPIPTAKHGKSDPPLIDEKEKSESAKSTHHGKEKKKPGIFPFLQLHSS